MDLYQNNGIDKNRMYMKESYLFYTHSTLDSGFTALGNCKVDPICCKHNAAEKLLHQLLQKEMMRPSQSLFLYVK